MRKFKIEITSVPDRENLVAEIWYSDFLLAEISSEAENPVIEFYFKECIRFNLDEFIYTLKKAAELLNAK